MTEKKSTTTKSVRATGGFPQLLAAFARAARDADVEVYDRYNDAYKPSDWTRDPASDEELATFAVNGMGSQYAFWFRETKDALQAPVVFLGRDGEAAVVAENVFGFFAIFAAGVDPSCAIAYGENTSDSPNEGLAAWLADKAPGKRFGTPKAILAQAAKAHPRFVAWVKGVQSKAKKDR